MKPNKSVQTTYSLILSEDKKRAPKIIFGATAMKWIDAMIDLHPQEVGFEGIVDERPDYTFFVRSIFYPKNSEADGGNCEISPEGETEMMEWLIANNREIDITRVRLWGHSHHNMGVGPSGQDEIQAVARMNDTRSFLIRIICNKRHEMSVSFFDYENKIRFDNVAWEAENDRVTSDDLEKIRLIKEALQSNGLSASEIFMKISKILNTDYEYERIKDKVERLKLVNLPKSGVKKNPRAINNAKWFERRDKNKDIGDLLGDYNNDMPNNFKRNVDWPNDSMEFETDEMISNWEENIGIKGG